MWTFIITVVIIAVVAFALFSILIWYISSGQFWLKVRRDSLAELEKQVYESLQEYLCLLGNDTPSVKEYLSIVQRRDILTLERKWPELSRAMREREVEKGFTGRPLIVDYHCYYETALAELARRTHNISFKADGPDRPRP